MELAYTLSVISNIFRLVWKASEGFISLSSFIQVFITILGALLAERIIKKKRYKLGKRPIKQSLFILLVTLVITIIVVFAAFLVYLLFGVLSGSVVLVY